MTNSTNRFARFQGSSLQHLLIPGSNTLTRCGKDATLAHRYPALTRANSTTRPYRVCLKCEAAALKANLT